MNKYDKDKFNKVIKDKVSDVKIEMPDTVKSNVLKTLNSLPDRKIKRKNKFRKISGLVAGVIICTLGFNMFMPAYAESLPIIGPTFKSINEAIGIGDKYIKGSRNINIRKSYKDTTMTIKNIYYDGVELAIAYELKSENGFDDKPIIFPIIKSGFKEINYDNEENNGEFVDENTYVGLASYALTKNELSDKAKIEFIVNDLYGNWTGYYPKKFSFKISLDAKNMGKKEHTLNKEFIYGNRIYKIREVITSKLNTIIYSDILKKDSSDNSIKNNGLGRTDDQLSFFIVDDRGMPLETGSLSLSSNIKFNKSLIGNSTMRFSAASEGAESITLIPYIYIYGSGKSIRGKIDKENEMVINLDTGEKYIIKNIDFKEDKTIIDIKAKKYLRGLKDLDISFWSGDNELIEEEPNNISIEEWNKEKSKIEIEDVKFNGIDDGYNFTLTLPALDSKKDYYFLVDNTKNIILEDEKITIDLDK